MIVRESVESTVGPGGSEAGIAQAASQANLEPTVRDIMTADPEAARFDDLFLDAMGRMNNRGVRHLPIIDGDRRVVGILSDRDVRSTIGEFPSTDEERRPVSLRMDFLRLADVVRAAPITISETAPVSQLVRIFVDQRIGAVPVVDEHERLVGIASYIDVLRMGKRP